MTPYNIQNTDFSLDDIKQVVNIHRQEIRQGFLSSLGNKALELLFSLAVESNYGVLFGEGSSLLMTDFGLRIWDFGD